MVITPRRLAAFTFVALWPGAAAAAGYCNDLYGYCITVPAARKMDISS